MQEVNRRGRWIAWRSQRVSYNADAKGQACGDDLVEGPSGASRRRDPIRRARRQRRQAGRV